MSDYLWPSLVTLVMVGWVCWRFGRYRSARQLVWERWAAVESALVRRRHAASELARNIRAFRPRVPEALGQLEAAREAAEAADKEALADRREPERGFTTAMLALPALVDADALLRIHAGCRKSLDGLAEARRGLAAALAEYNAAVERAGSIGRQFPETLVLHVLDLPELTPMDVGSDPLVESAVKLPILRSPSSDSININAA